MYGKLYIAAIFTLLLSVATVQAERNDHLARAKELYMARRWSDARFELLKAKDEITHSNTFKHEEINMYLALCSVGLEEESAVSRLNDFMSRYPNSIYSNQVSFNKGLLLSTSQDYESAHLEFSKVNYSKLSHAERDDYDIRMGYISFLKGDYNSATKHFGRIPIDSQYFEHALYYKSYIDYINGALDSAKDGFTRLTLSNTYSALAPFYLLQIEFKQGNYQYVISSGEALMKDSSVSRQADIARTVAEAYFRVDGFEGAIKYMAIYEGLGAKMSREDSYILGFSLYRITRYKVAIEQLKRASGADDELTQNASYHLADCYLRLGNKRGAMQAFAMASNDKYNPEIAEDALFNYGKLQFELGGGVFNEAINVLTRYVNKYPKSSRTPDAKKILVAAYYNSESYDAAYKAIKEVRNPDAEIRSALQKIAYFRALEAMNRGEYATAKQNFKESESVAISPKYSALSRFWQGEINYFEGNYNTALRDFNTYLSRAPKGEQTYIDAHYSTAYTLLKSGNDTAAKSYFERYLSMNPTNATLRGDAHNRVGDILYARRQFTEASKSYQKGARSQNSGGDYAKYQLSMVDGIQGFTNRKIAGLKAIIDSNRGEYVDNAQYELGRTYMTLERYNEAKQSLEQFILKYPSSPNHAQALSDLGLIHLNLGDRSGAVSYYDKAIKYAPQSKVSKDALQGIREIYVTDGDAKGYFDYAAKMGFDSDLGAVAKDSLSFASAQRLYLQNTTPRATTALDAYVKEYPQGYYLSDALFLLSDCHIKNGDNKKAIESLTKLSDMSYNQYTQRVLENLSQLTHKAGEYDQAARAYRRLYDVTKSSSQRAKAMNGYATCVIETKDREGILTMADDVLSKKDAGEEATTKAKYAKATILRENGQWTEAVKLYQDLASEPTTAIGAESRYHLISNAHRAGDIEQAEKMIFELSDTGTSHSYWLAKAFITLGDIYVVRGDIFQARATYQSIVDGYTPHDDGVVEEAKSRIENLRDDE